MPFRDVLLALNPTAYYREGEASGTAIIDEKGGTSGTYVNAPTLGSTGLLTGDSDTAVTWNGTSQRGDLPVLNGGSGLAQSGFAATIWGLFTTSATGLEYVWTESTSANAAAAFALACNVTTGRITVQWRNNANAQFLLTTTGSYNDGAVHTFAIVKTATDSIALYIDGGLAPCSTANPSATSAISGAISINQSTLSAYRRNVVGQWWNGKTDEIAFWSGTALSGTDIATLDQAAKALWITGTALPSGEAFGTPVVSTVNPPVSPSGIASGEAFGSPTVTTGPVTVSPTGIASGQALGAATVTTGPVMVSPTGIGSGEATGSATVTPGAATVQATGIATAGAFGSAAVTTGPVIVQPTGIPSGEALGSATVQPGPVTVSPTGVPSAQGAGTPTVTFSQTVSPTGIGSGEAMPAPVLTVGPVTVTPAGLASTEALGTAVIQPGPVTVSPTGISSGEQHGTPLVTEVQLILAGAITSVETFGGPVVLPGAVTVVPVGLDTGEGFGQPVVVPGPVTVAPAAVASEEMLGNAIVAVHGQFNYGGDDNPAFTYHGDDNPAFTYGG